mmetsp:Transcript_13741/g.37448  ORF Transcript_13741/g.37448 Transcript_13741/m.37448 type:complete len:228 (-) Transcript_13741:167-850(-)
MDPSEASSTERSAPATSMATARLRTIEMANSECPASRKASPASVPACCSKMSAPPGCTTAKSVTSQTTPSIASQRSPSRECALSSSKPIFARPPIKPALLWMYFRPMSSTSPPIGTDCSLVPMKKQRANIKNEPTAAPTCVRWRFASWSHLSGNGQPHFPGSGSHNAISSANNGGASKPNSAECGTIAQSELLVDPTFSIKATTEAPSLRLRPLFPEVTCANASLRC